MSGSKVFSIIEKKLAAKINHWVDCYENFVSDAILKQRAPF